MNELFEMNCEKVGRDTKKLADQEIGTYLQQVPRWNLDQKQEEFRLNRQFKFKNFIEALAFTQKVGELAEQQNHHPLLQTEWGQVTVSWWTHVVHGLHINDFIMAAKTDHLYIYDFKGFTH